MNIMNKNFCFIQLNFVILVEIILLIIVIQ